MNGYPSQYQGGGGGDDMSSASMQFVSNYQPPPPTNNGVPSGPPSSAQPTTNNPYAAEYLNTVKENRSVYGNYLDNAYTYDPHKDKKSHFNTVYETDAYNPWGILFYS